MHKDIEDVKAMISGADEAAFMWGRAIGPDHVSAHRKKCRSQLILALVAVTRKDGQPKFSDEERNELAYVGLAPLPPARIGKANQDDAARLLNTSGGTLSDESVTRLRRMGLDPKYVGVKDEADLIELRDKSGD